MGRLGGSVGLVSSSWSQLRSWSHSPDSKPHIGLCDCLVFSLHCPPPGPLLVLSLSLTLSFKINFKRKKWEKQELQIFIKYHQLDTVNMQVVWSDGLKIKLERLFETIVKELGIYSLNND